MMSQSTAAALVLALAYGCTACRRSPAVPDQAPLDIGRWSGDGACLWVTDAGCDLIVGCGHGQFPRPIIRADGTFDVDGTYRIEAGPVSIEPAPPAHFAGSVSGIGLVLTVVPVSLPKASYGFVRSESRPCSILCLSVGTTSRLSSEPSPARKRRSTWHDSLLGGRFWWLPRNWAIDVATSRNLGKSLACGDGRLDCHEVSRQYLHFRALAGTA
jgi:hypothetical protein